jgi:hypothetical protein
MVAFVGEEGEIGEGEAASGVSGFRRSVIFLDVGPRHPTFIRSLLWRLRAGHGGRTPAGYMLPCGHCHWATAQFAVIFSLTLIFFVNA